MNYQELYKEKLTTADAVAAQVKSGDWVDYGWCANTPVAFDAALAKRMPELTDVKVRGGILMWVPEIFKIENPAEHFSWNSWHMSGIERKAIAEGFSFYGPIRYSELPRYYRDMEEDIAVNVFQVSEMDQHGQNVVPVTERDHVILISSYINIYSSTVHQDCHTFL